MRAWIQIILNKQNSNLWSCYSVMLDNTLVFVSGMFTASAFELGTIKEITGTDATAETQTPHKQTQVQNNTWCF